MSTVHVEAFLPLLPGIVENWLVLIRYIQGNVCRTAAAVESAIGVLLSIQDDLITRMYSSTWCWLHIFARFGWDFQIICCGRQSSQMQDCRWCDLWITPWSELGLFSCLISTARKRKNQLNQGVQIYFI